MEARDEAGPAREAPAMVRADSIVDALLIPAAAIVAQQSALFERERRLDEREAALAEQESQLAERLEEQRRQLLQLQEQITEARERLRRQHAEFENLTRREQAELERVRAQAGDLMSQAKADRQRLSRLHQRLRERWRHERRTLDAARKNLAHDRERLTLDRQQHLDMYLANSTRIELDKRRLRDAWGRLNAERKLWRERRTAELADLNARSRDLARRAKAIRAAESQQTSERTRLDQEIAERRRQIEYLEIRIEHARQRLLQAGPTEVTDIPSDAAPISLPAATVPADSQLSKLVQLARDLTDQRLWIVEQAERLERARLAWTAERDAAARELDELAATLEDKELELNGRAQRLASGEQRLRVSSAAVIQSRLQLDAEQVRRNAVLLHKQRQVEEQNDLLAERHRQIELRERDLNRVLRIWGQRQRTAMERWAEATRACHAERAEWAAARETWLHEHEKVVRERGELAVQTLALEQLRSEWLDEHGSAVVRKKLERIERHWVQQFTADVRELDRLRETLAAESLRLDESTERIRQDERKIAEAFIAVGEQSAALEAERADLASARHQLADAALMEKSQHKAAHNQIAALREEVEGLARLLIDSPAALERAA